MKSKKQLERKIEKQKILIDRYQLFTKWILRRDKDILESQRGRDLIFEIDKIESELVSIDNEPEAKVTDCISFLLPRSCKGVNRGYFQPHSINESAEENNIVNSYCGNPITSEDTCNVLAKKKTCKGCNWRVNNEPVESKTAEEIPIAFEWHNYQTGHSYVDYIPKANMTVMQGYDKIPLYYASRQQPSREIDINTPFFGNSGATVPVESKSVNRRDEVTIKELEDMLTDSTECDDCPFFKAPNEVTDEDIEKAAEEHAIFLGYAGKYNTNIAKQVSFIAGAKAMKNGKIKKQ
jgi:hypothetical protein